jgi:Mor family transcriptional regulator
MPIEIENIVNDFNSHRELSKKYGLSEEVIYRVKAMYR